MRLVGIASLIVFAFSASEASAATFNFRCVEKQECFFTISLSKGVRNFTLKPGEVDEIGGELKVGDAYFVASEVSDANPAKCSLIKQNGGWCRGPVRVKEGTNQ